MKMQTKLELLLGRVPVPVLMSVLVLVPVLVLLEWVPVPVPVPEQVPQSVQKCAMMHSWF